LLIKQFNAARGSLVCLKVRGKEYVRELVGEETRYWSSPFLRRGLYWSWL